MKDDYLLGESGDDAGGSLRDPSARPCSVKALEALHVASFGFGLWVSPPGMMLEALPWLAGLLLMTLAVSRLRLALVWLLYSACCIGFLIFVPINAAFYISRFDGNTWAVVRLVYMLALTGGTLALLWSRKTTDWLRAGGGKLSMLVM
ncbi:hypothetical protein [Croceicoccus bisphenolivorans]|uniref:hypothetical protein n=1 Tax=Croceicoccus bisphenolivorans TaxID=1783232 RepID=UPI000A8FDCBA|nr:hypothetical protein [Croceicoccus bisphenolivorans]